MKRILVYAPEIRRILTIGNSMTYKFHDNRCRLYGDRQSFMDEQLAMYEWQNVIYGISRRGIQERNGPHIFTFTYVCMDQECVMQVYGHNEFLFVQTQHNRRYLCNLNTKTMQEWQNAFHYSSFGGEKLFQHLGNEVWIYT